MLPVTALAFRPVKAGRWTVYLSTARHFGKRRDDWLGFRVSVPRRGQSLSLR